MTSTCEAAVEERSCVCTAVVRLAITHGAAFNGRIRLYLEINEQAPIVFVNPRFISPLPLLHSSLLHPLGYGEAKTLMMEELKIQTRG